MDEVPSDDEDDDAFETRTRPNVMTEDVFLGLSDKDPSSAHCEAMVVRVECPGHRLDDIELDVKRQKLLLLSSTLCVHQVFLHVITLSLLTCTSTCCPQEARAASAVSGSPPRRPSKMGPQVAVHFSLSSHHPRRMVDIAGRCSSLAKVSTLSRWLHCLDCKHNFCRSCILLHLKQRNSVCPCCQLPTRPSEVTRNQFLESILAAWNGVEKELECLNGDPAQHATKITMADTDRALYRAASGTGAIGDIRDSEDTQQEETKHSSRGPVANHKWHIDTQEIRQELKLDQPYLPQNYGRQSGSTAHWKKTSSSDLPDDYGGSASANSAEGNRSRGERSNGRKSKKKMPAVSLDEASATESEGRMQSMSGDSEEEKEGEHSFLSPQPSSLMATQEVESYLERITKQREALSQWEKNHNENSDGKSSLLDLERSLHQSTGFDDLLKERRRESQLHDEDGDLLTQMTQMPPATNALESPDLLASFRRRQHLNDYSERENGQRLDSKAKRRVLLTSTPSLHPRGQISSPSRKRLRVLSSQTNFNTTGGHSAASAIDLSQNDSDDEAPDSPPATMLPEEEHKSSDSDDDNDSNYENDSDDDGDDDDDDDDNDDDDDEDYEMKPAVPLPPTPERTLRSSDQQCQRLSDLFKKERVSDDFRSAITAFQSDEKRNSTSSSPKSEAARQLVSSAHHSRTEDVAANEVVKQSGITRPSSAGNSTKPPVHTSITGTRNARSSDNGSDFVFVSSDLTRNEVKRVLEATQRLGGKFGHDFDLKRDPAGHFCTSVTHLITKAVPGIGAPSGAEPDELRCKRTAKYMRALAEGSFVMDFSWITASMAAGRWLTEEPFEMIGDIYSDAVRKPHEGRIRRVQTGRRNSIFSMFCFVLLVSEKEFDFQFASVKALVNNFGGTVVHADSYAKLNPKQRTRRTPIGVVSKTTSPWDAKAKWQQFQIPIVRITWIFDSVSHLEVLPFDDYYPY
ncbi:unnamed protein product [Phytophthora lilii]|uniref:Unnamed protein product n=1 Tax=Phytophthora lilii TaxID=2077276 RepID=A0A9W6WPY5_9STRA|nr:unnamed protein product [Phytophthora lilii]